MTIQKHTGSCHCGAITYEAELDLARGGSRCNCSICTKTASFGTMTKPDQFRLLTGKDDLGVYVWGGNVSQRMFCKTCGVQCYGQGHLAELGGDFVSVNLNTLDGVDPATLAAVYWDGRHDNWQAGSRDAPWPIG